MSGRWLRVGALGMAVVLASCASAPPKPVVEAFEPESQPSAECTTQAPSGNGAARLGRAVGYGALGVFLGALQGAGEGASWALWTGGSMSDGAWIGAAAGAGVGFLIGFVTGLATAGTGWSPEPATSPACPEALVKSTAPAEDNTKPERTR
jgi:hypothetical protein